MCSTLLAIRPDSPTVRVCSCGRRYSSWTWAQLWLVGFFGPLELRNCAACHSTIARLIPWVSSDPTDYEPGGFLGGTPVQGAR